MKKYVALALLGTALSSLAAAPAAAQDLRKAIQADMPSLIEIYKDLHANPYGVTGDQNAQNNAQPPYDPTFQNYNIPQIVQPGYMPMQQGPAPQAPQASLPPGVFVQTDNGQ